MRNLNAVTGIVVLLTLGILLGAGGLLVYIGHNENESLASFKEKCQTVQATVVDYDKERKSSGLEENHEYYEYDKIYEYSYKDQVYRVKGSQSSRQEPLIGSRENVFINPDNPEEMRTILSDGSGNVFMLLGIAIILVSVMLCFVLFFVKTSVPKWFVKLLKVCGFIAFAMNILAIFMLFKNMIGIAFIVILLSATVYSIGFKCIINEIEMK